jgi:hypothetical protein
MVICQEHGRALFAATQPQAHLVVAVAAQPPASPLPSLLLPQPQPLLLLIQSQAQAQALQPSLAIASVRNHQQLAAFQAQRPQ